MHMPFCLFIMLGFIMAACGNPSQDKGKEGDASITLSPTGDSPELSTERSSSQGTPKNNCKGTFCWDFPENECDTEAGDLMTYTSSGKCNNKGECIYEPTYVSCSCNDGACMDTPCQGVLCMMKPDCLNGNVVQYQSPACSQGECDYELFEVTCENGCDDGSCIDEPCAGKLCEHPNASYCQDENTLVSYEPVGVCRESDGECLYDELEIPCEIGCEGGSCKEHLCANVFCQKPPPSHCRDDTTLVAYAKTGRCYEGACYYTGNEYTCKNGCVDGRCEGEKCIGITCQSPPANRCVDEKTLRFYPVAGVCSDGVCRYEPEDHLCQKGCSEGRCVDDPCAGKTCKAVPSSTCDGGTLTIWQLNEEMPCKDGKCQYLSEIVECDGGCSKGQCEDACSSMVCEVPPSHCIENTMISFELTGCHSGSCRYKSVETVCALTCENGRCVDFSDTDSSAETDSDILASVETDSHIDLPDNPVSSDDEVHPAQETDSDSSSRNATDSETTDSETVGATMGCDMFELVMETGEQIESGDFYALQVGSEVVLKAYCDSADVTDQVVWNADELYATFSSTTDGSALLTAGNHFGIHWVSLDYGSVHFDFELRILPVLLKIKVGDYGVVSQLEVGESVELLALCYADADGQGQLCNLPVTWAINNSVLASLTNYRQASTTLTAKAVGDAQIHLSLLEHPVDAVPIEVEIYQEADTSDTSSHDSENATDSDSDTETDTDTDTLPDAGEPDAGGTDSETDTDTDTELTCDSYAINIATNPVLLGSPPIPLTAVCKRDGVQTDISEQVIWQTDGDTVATVSSDGMLTNIHPGTVRIDALMDSTSISHINVTVLGPTSITIEPASGQTPIYVGQEVAFDARCQYGNMEDSCYGLTWKVAGSGVSIDSLTGVATAHWIEKGDGMRVASIQAQIAAVLSETFNMIVYQPMQIEVISDGKIVAVREEKSLTAYCHVGSDMDVQLCTEAVDWHSSDSRILIVDPNGLATGNSVGDVNVSCFMDGHEYEPTGFEVWPTKVQGLLLAVYRHDSGPYMLLEYWNTRSQVSLDVLEEQQLMFNGLFGKIIEVDGYVDIPFEENRYRGTIFVEEFEVVGEVHDGFIQNSLILDQ